MKAIPKTYFIYLILLIFMGWQGCEEKEKPTPPEEMTPATPTNLDASALSYDHIQLTWVDNTTHEVSVKFLIERSKGTNENFELIDSTDFNRTVFEDTDLEPNTVYFYRIRASTSAFFVSEYSNEANAQTESNLIKPLGLRAEALSPFAVQLFWLDNNDKETAYKIQRSVGDESNFKEIAILNFDVTNFKDENLEPLTKYFYRIQASNLQGISEFSDVVAIETLEEIPNAPINFQGIPLSTTEIELKWSDVSDNETAFEIERSTSTNANFKAVARKAKNSTSHIDKNLEPATTYFYRIRAVKNDLYSEYSSVISVQTNLHPPLVPTSPNAEATSETTGKLTWEDKSDNEAGYRLFRRVGLLGDYEQLTELGANVTEYVMTGLTPNTTYYFIIQAFNSGGESPKSRETSLHTPDYPPKTPTSLVANAVSGSQVNLTWIDNSHNEQSFIIERSTDNLTFKELVKPFQNATSFNDVNVTPNTQYYYRIKAINTFGESLYTASASAKTPQVIPATPTGLIVTTFSGSKLQLSWADNSNNENGFIILRSKSINGTYNEVTRLTANTTTYIDTGLEINTLYYYVIKAYNSIGQSPASNISGTKTSNGKPTAPRLDKLEALVRGEVKVSWTETSNEGDKIIVEVSEQSQSNFKENARFDTKGANQSQEQTIGNLKGQTIYFIRLRTLSGTTFSDYSNVISVTTTTAPPVAPSDFTGRATSSNSIQLTWTDNSNDETAFTIERSINGTSYIHLTNVTGTIYVDNQLLSDVTYFYRIKAYNGLGESKYVETKALTPREGAPLPASNIILASSGTPLRINISWTDNSTNEDGFRVERKTATGTYQVIATLLSGATSYTDTNVTGNTQYFYRVTAYTHQANAPASSEKSIILEAIPNAPFGVSGSYTQNPHTVQLSWQMLNYETLKSNKVLTGFHIERSTGSNTNFTKIVTVDANTLTYKDTSLNSNTIYYYRVKAYNSKGESSPSSEYAVQTQP